MMELAAQIAHEQECTDPDNIVGNPAVHAVDKDALVVALCSTLRLALTHVPNDAQSSLFQINNALSLAREAGYP